jgi:Tol biopolymer transport system component/predicted Ser/Thr protein kinase
MGEVWKARDTRVDRIVAIKISQQQFSERFEREARAIAALNHPNICSLYDVGPDYLVMEYVDGSPIRPVQGARKLLDLAVQIADGLAAAHDRGITHRDLKPENILVTGPASGDPGRVKMVDFGLAKLDAAPKNADATQAVTVTQPGMVVGTVAYMSPEQARGLPLDFHSDQFSFGAILYELASGERPFSGDSAPQTMAAIIERDPEPLPRTVPAPLRWIVERCLAKEPSARYESTRDLYRELNSLRGHISEALASSGSVAAGGGRRAIRRWLWPAVALAGAMLTAAAGYWWGVRGRSAAAPLAPVPLTSSGGMVLNPSFSPDGSEVVFAWDGPRGGNHNLYVKLIGSNDLLRLTSGAADEISPAWAPDGKRIAFVRSLGHGKRAVMLVSPLGGSERKLTEVSLDDFGPEGHAVLAWTPDGRFLAAADGSGLDLISVDSAERQPLLREKPGVNGDADPAFSPGGDRLAYVRRLGPFSSRPFWIRLAAGYRPAGTPQEVHTPGMVAYAPLWDRHGQLVLAAGAPFGMRLYRATLPAGSAVPVAGAMIGGSMALHRESGRLLYTSLQNIQNLYRMPLAGPGQAGHAPERLTSTSGVDFFPSYAPDGASIAFASFRFAQFGVWTIQTGNPLLSEIVDWGQGLVATGDWSSDGKSVLAFGTGPQGLYQIYRIAVDTRKVTRLINDAEHDVYPTFSRDGGSVYFTSTANPGPLQLYKMPVSGGHATLVVARMVVRARESADGRWLYFAEWIPGRLYRMPLAGGDITQVIEGLTDPAGYVLGGPGVYYWAGNRSAPELRYMDLATRKVQLILQPPIPAAPNLTMSPDGHWLCFPLIERNSQELMMIENWS